jgi:putative heme iron utilization protein
MSHSIETATRAFQELRSLTRTLILATADETGMPEASTTPFIQDEAGDYFILVSQLARHTGNLKARPQASVMLLEDEATSSQLFARCRIQLQCEASAMTISESPDVVDQFRIEHGKIIELLSTLPDFLIYRLHPISGQFVMGFGQAYHLEGPGLGTLTPIKPGT